MGISDLQKFVTNDLLVFRENITGRLDEFRYIGENVLIGRIDEQRFKAESFSEINDNMFGGIVGGAQPSDYSASLRLWNGYFRSAGTKAIYFGFDLPQQMKEGVIAPEQPQLADFLRIAINDKMVYEITITDPYKETAFKFLQSIHGEISENAMNIGVINHIVKSKNGTLYGLNTDGLGMVKALAGKRNLQASSILVLGAGGASRAISYELVRAGINELVILNRTKPKAKGLAEKLSGYSKKKNIKSGSLGAIDAHLKKADIIINTITEGVGLSETQAADTKKDSLFVDARYGEKALFCRLASRIGRDFEDGKGMLFGQFVEALTVVEKKVFNRDLNKKALEGVQAHSS